MKTPSRERGFESPERDDLVGIRRRLALTQYAMADKLGVALATYGKYERGERRITNRLMVTARDLELALSPRDEATGRAMRMIAAERPLDEIAPAREPIVEGAPLPFWLALRSEAFRIRERSYSKAAQAMISFRNGLFVTATSFVGLKHLALSFDLRFGFAASEVDYVFLGAYFIILTLFVPLLQEMPILKAAGHLIARLRR